MAPPSSLSSIVYPTRTVVALYVQYVQRCAVRVCLCLCGQAQVHVQAWRRWLLSGCGSLVFSPWKGLVFS